MDKILADRLLEAACSELTAIVREAWPVLIEDMGAAMIQHAEETEATGKAFKYRAGLYLELSPTGETVTAYAGLNWAIKRRVDSAGKMVDAHPELDFAENLTSDVDTKGGGAIES